MNTIPYAAHASITQSDSAIFFLVTSVGKVYSFFRVSLLTTVTILDLSHYNVQSWSKKSSINQIAVRASVQRAQQESGTCFKNILAQKKKKKKRTGERGGVYTEHLSSARQRIVKREASDALKTLPLVNKGGGGGREEGCSRRNLAYFTDPVTQTRRRRAHASPGRSPDVRPSGARRYHPDFFPSGAEEAARLWVRVRAFVGACARETQHAPFETAGTDGAANSSKRDRARPTRDRTFQWRGKKRPGARFLSRGGARARGSPETMLRAPQSLF